MHADDLLAGIKQTRKYASVSDDLIRRVIAEESVKRAKDKELEKAVKNRLHMIYGAFTAPDLHKKAAAALAGDDVPGAARTLLSLHASTRERLPDVEKFYSFLHAHIGPVRSVLDVGCGFNPFSYPFMGGLTPRKYYACDIDLRELELIASFFARLGVDCETFGLDAVATTPAVCADAAFLFKLVPVLEGQKKGRGFDLLRELASPWAVVTFPAKSLGGREKSMTANYSRMFEEHLDPGRRIVAKEVIGVELAYIVRSRLGESAGDGI